MKLNEARQRACWALGAALFVSLFATNASANNFLWLGDDGNWSNAALWDPENVDPDGIPNSGDRADIGYRGYIGGYSSSGTVLIDSPQQAWLVLIGSRVVTSEFHYLAGSLEIDGTGSNTGSLAVSATLTVGNYASGILTQNGGSVTALNLNFSPDTVSNTGTYYLNDGGTVNAGNINMNLGSGTSGGAYFHHNNGTVETDELGIGDDGSTYTLTTGLLDVAGDMKVGRDATQGASAFQQNSGTVEAGRLYVASDNNPDPGATVEYRIDAGQLNVIGTSSHQSQLYVGHQTNGVGTVTQTGGDVLVDDQLLGGISTVQLGWQNGSRGSYNMSGGSLTTDKLNVGYDEFPSTPKGYGELHITGATADITVRNKLEVNSRGTLDFVADAAGVSLIDVDGTVSLDGVLLVNLDALVGTPGEITLIDNDLADALSGTFNTVTISDSQGRGYYLDYAGGDGNDLTLVVPEPASLTLLGLSGLLIVRRRRKV